MLALVAILWGVIVALACGGDLRHLGRLRLAGEAFIVPCFVFQAVVRGRGFGLTGIPSVSISLWAAASLVLCICLLLNWRRPGCYLAAVGVMLNVLVVLANRGMPVGLRPGSDDVAVAASGAQSQFYLVDSSGALMRTAADAIPLEFHGEWMMLSIGDVLLVVGIGVLLVSVTLESCTPKPNR